MNGYYHNSYDFHLMNMQLRSVDRSSSRFSLFSYLDFIAMPGLVQTFITPQHPIKPLHMICIGYHCHLR